MLLSILASFQGLLSVSARVSKRGSLAEASEELLEAFRELPVVAKTRAWHQSVAENWRKEAENLQKKAEEPLGPLVQRRS